MDREAAALASLACWAGQFTPRVSLLADGLLLEVGGSLRLFDGPGPLTELIRAGVEAQGYAFTLAMAPTPQAAQWLAIHSPGWLCRSLANLKPALDDCPVALLPRAAAEQLHAFGIATLGAARRLPATDLARRIGPEPLALLARAYGELPDLRPDFVFPDQFDQRLELPASVESAAALLFAARRLTAALAGWLAARQAGIAACTLHLAHREGSTPLALGFAGSTRDPGRLERVLREKLERLVLTAPVEALRLEARAIQSLPGHSDTLFDDGRTGEEAMAALLERLRARLGEARVFGLAATADHRPERATEHGVLMTKSSRGGAAAGRGRKKSKSAAVVAPEVATPPRPCWLLPQPQPIDERRGRPHYRGPLLLLAGPERIESGWWDTAGEGAGEAGVAGGEVRRDYFVALSPDQRWLWIYRELRAPGGWFLHGLFA